MAVEDHYAYSSQVPTAYRQEQAAVRRHYTAPQRTPAPTPQPQQATRWTDARSQREYDRRYQLQHIPGRVWVGTRPRIVSQTPVLDANGRLLSPYATANVDVYRDEEIANWDFADLSPQMQVRLAQGLDAYFGPGRWDPSWVKNHWKDAVDIAKARQIQGDERVSPFEAFDDMLRGMGILGVGGVGQGGGGSSGGGGYGGYGGYGGGGGGGGGGGATSVSQSTTLTNPDQARSLANQALTAFLGRQARPEEVDSFTRALNTHERLNPMVQTSMADETGSTTVVEGGVDPTEFAREWAQGKKGYSEFQAATTFLDAFTSALADPMGG